MPSQPPVTKRKPSAPRKETHLCDAFDHDLEMLFLTYYRHRQETSDASTDQLLSRFDAVGETGFRAFEDIAQLSQRLVRLDVALTSHRGGLLDTLDSLSSEYDSVMDAVLRALASFANYLLECRAPLRPSGPSCPPRVSEMEMAVKGWQAALAEVQIHTNAIQEHWPQTIQVLETELNDLPPLPLLSWLRWMDPDNLKGNLRDLPHDLANIKDTAIRDMVSLMRACANLGSALNETRQSASAKDLRTIETTLEELIRLNVAFMRYRAGCWISNRTVFEQGR
ncbi:hypothetical protein FB45DRAFT_949399, partial [Roridomyces roridus]